jgi:error-prone DNA polymerase
MFTHLHVHTHFSFGVGISSPEKLVEAAAERGFPTLACTDTNGVYGAVEFQCAAEAAGVRPILGAHLSLNGQETVALATDERGWAALIGGRTSSSPPSLPPTARDYCSFRAMSPSSSEYVI